MNEVLSKLIPLAEAHRDAYEYVNGIYWDGRINGGCGVGCTIHDAILLGILPLHIGKSNHTAIAGITKTPTIYWQLLDKLFEGMKGPVDFTPRYLKALAICDNFKAVGQRIILGLLELLVKRFDYKEFQQLLDLWKSYCEDRDVDLYEVKVGNLSYGVSSIISIVQYCSYDSSGVIEVIHRTWLLLGENVENCTIISEIVIDGLINNQGDKNGDNQPT